MCPEWHFLKRQCVASTDRGYSVIADSVSSPVGQREAPVGRGEGLRRAMEQPWPGCRLLGGQRIAGRSGNPCPLAGGAVPGSYVLIEAEFDAAMIERVDPAGLPAHWRESPPPVAAQRIGDAWLAGATSAVLQVASALVPMDWNYLLNPAHRDFRRITIGSATPISLDPRLVKTPPP